MRQRLAKIPGMVDLQVERQVRIPQLEITVDYRKAALYGLQPAQITEQLERLSNGRLVSRLVDGNRRFDLVVRLADRVRTTQGLADLLIETPSGWVPLRQVAEVKETDGPNQILRENTKRRIVVLANSDGDRDMAAIIADIRREIASQRNCRPAFSPASKAHSRRRKSRCARSGCCRSSRSAMVFAILYSRYRSVLFALIIMGSVPLALIGSVVALWWAGSRSRSPA